jgi:uncharacterized protein (UPF0332 family)
LSLEVQDEWSRALRALRTAQALVGEDPDAAASRAYYAAFHAVSALLALQGQSFRKHTAVERAVHRDLVKTGRWPPEVGAAFSWLANLRYTGDYGGETHVQTSEALEAVEKATLILEAVRTTLRVPEILPPEGDGQPEGDQDEEE